MGKIPLSIDTGGGTYISKAVNTGVEFIGHDELRYNYDLIDIKRKASHQNFGIQPFACCTSSTYAEYAACTLCGSTD